MQQSYHQKHTETYTSNSYIRGIEISYDTIHHQDSSDFQAILIAVSMNMISNPPTGAHLSATEMRTLVDAATLVKKDTTSDTHP